MRKLDVTIVTEDEEYLAIDRILERVEVALQSLNLDTYNETYVVRLTVDTVDQNPEETA